MPIRAEYIWIDGTEPSPLMRSKTRIIERGDRVENLPLWGFDGSSTNQAPGANSDCVLRPVFVCPDPIRGGDDILVLCEVLLPDTMEPHPSNTRAALVEVAEKYADQGMWFGMEQEYTLFQEGRPLGWPEQGYFYPAPQGPYYCGVGAIEIAGREVVEAHTEACMLAGLTISGTNAEVMLGQWEYQIGPLPPVEVGDEMWMARYLLYRIAEDFNINASVSAKPIKGDWNGAGCHTNFSTQAMRDGYDAVVAACESMGTEEKVQEHLEVYGHGYEDRLTGQHETAHFSQFRYGVSDRGASIRIPWQVAQEQRGYAEDRRPNANCDPYAVARVITNTVCSAEVAGGRKVSSKAAVAAKANARRTTKKAPARKKA